MGHRLSKLMTDEITEKNSSIYIVYNGPICYPVPSHDTATVGFIPGKQVGCSSRFASAGLFIEG
jgi:hypothetical protein